MMKLSHPLGRFVTFLAGIAFAAAGSSLAQVAGGLSTGRNTAGAQLTSAMAQIGLTTCAPKLQEAAEFLFENSPAAIRLQPLGPDPNRWPTVLTIESSHATNGATRFATVMMAPAGTCSGFYQQVIYWAQACPLVKKQIFESYTNERTLLRAVRLSDANPGLQVALMPDGAGCISIKKELIH